MNLAVHVSAPRELWHSLRTGIEEARQIFSPDARDMRSNRFNSQRARRGPHLASGLVNVRLSL
jgi:hypothetical protein